MEILSFSQRKYIQKWRILLPAEASLGRGTSLFFTIYYNIWVDTYVGCDMNVREYLSEYLIRRHVNLSHNSTAIM